MEEREKALHEALQNNEVETERWLTYKKDNETAIENLEMFAKHLTLDVMVPVGKKAFFPGQLIHTNEVLVGHYQGYFSKCSAFKAKEICQLRIKKAAEHLEALEKEEKLWQDKLEKPYADGAVPSGNEIEIVEEYDEEKEKVWRERHRQHVKAAKLQEKLERNKLMERPEEETIANATATKTNNNEHNANESNDADDVLKKLEQLELMEELEKDFEHLEAEGVVSVEMIRQLMAGEGDNIPPTKTRIAHNRNNATIQPNSIETNNNNNNNNNNKTTINDNNTSNEKKQVDEQKKSVEETSAGGGEKEENEVLQGIVKKSELNNAQNRPLPTNNNSTPNPNITLENNAEDSSDEILNDDVMPEEVLLIRNQAKFLPLADQIGFYEYQIQIMREKMRSVGKNKYEESLKFLEVIEQLEFLLDQVEIQLGDEELVSGEEIETNQISNELDDVESGVEVEVDEEVDIEVERRAAKVNDQEGCASSNETTEMTVKPTAESSEEGVSLYKELQAALSSKTASQNSAAQSNSTNNNNNNSSSSSSSDNKSSNSDTSCSSGISSKEATAAEAPHEVLKVQSQQNDAQTFKQKPKRKAQSICNYELLSQEIKKLQQGGSYSASMSTTTYNHNVNNSKEAGGKENMPQIPTLSNSPFKLNAKPLSTNNSNDDEPCTSRTAMEREKRLSRAETSASLSQTVAISDQGKVHKKRISFALEDQTLEFCYTEAVSEMLYNSGTNEVPKRDIISLNDSITTTNTNANDSTKNSEIVGQSEATVPDRRQQIMERVEKNMNYVSENQSVQHFDMVSQILNETTGTWKTLYIYYTHSNQKPKDYSQATKATGKQEHGAAGGDADGEKNEAVAGAAVGEKMTDADAVANIPCTPADFYENYLKLLQKDKDVTKAADSIVYLNSYPGEELVKVPILQEKDREASYISAKSQFSLSSGIGGAAGVELAHVEAEAQEANTVLAKFPDFKLKSILRNKEAVANEPHMNEEAYREATKPKEVVKKKKKKSKEPVADEQYMSAYSKVMKEVVEKPAAAPAPLSVEPTRQPDPLPKEQFVDVHAPKKRLSRFKLKLIEDT